MKINNKAKRIKSKLLNGAASLCAKPSKMIACESFKGRSYSDNPRMISEKMHEMYPDYRIVWGINGAEKYNSAILPSYVEVMELKSWKYRKARASSVAYVRNEAMTEDLVKTKGQLFIQTWHGDRGIKQILYDAWPAGKRATPVMDNELTDYFVIGSDYAERRIKTAFKYSGKVIKNGCPRNDCLVDPYEGVEIRKRLGIEEHKKILLYAPTMRVGMPTVKSYLDIQDTLEHLNNRGGDWVCIVRAHPKSLGIEIQEGGDIINGSSYPDMSDLLMIADALITDYSSCAGDFILRKKPVILAQFDKNDYKRDLCVDINEAGFLVAYTQEELDRFFDELSDGDFDDNCERVLRYFGTHETGHSAEDVCRLINEHYEKSIH